MAGNSSPRLSESKRFTACIAAVTFFVAGCGSGRPAVEGRVTLDGEPITYGSIMLVPADGKGQTAGTGIANGLYRMEASAGPMKVIINSPKKTDRKQHVPTPEDTGAMADLYVDAVPARYNEATELEVTVVPGRNTFDFALESEKSPRP
jgi:hypothetical protein